VTEGFSRIDEELCTGCGICAKTCPTDAISGELHKPHIISEERCVSCGRCVQVCCAYDTIFQEFPTSRAKRLEQRGLTPSTTEPLFAAYNRFCLAEVKAALANPNLVAMTQFGPAISGTIAEDFGMAIGSISTGRIVAALKKIGFRKVYSYTLPAALAVLEQAQEMTERLQSGKILPVINSSCPAAVKYIEQSYPELIHYLAPSKSPHQIAGTLLKSYVAGMLKLNPAQIYSVSIGPCTSRKFEITRPELSIDGTPNVDAALTARELACLIKDSGVDLMHLPEENFDTELPVIGGMENIYCTPGDIATAVLYASQDMLAQGSKDPLNVKFTEIGTEGVSTASMKLGSYEIKAAAVAGLTGAVPFFDAMKAGKHELAFLELLACPLGCVSGSGQPKVLLPKDKPVAYAERAKLHSGLDAKVLSALSRHPAVQRMYRDFFGKPCGDKANRALHTQYVERKLS